MSGFKPFCAWFQTILRLVSNHPMSGSKPSYVWFQTILCLPGKSSKLSAGTKQDLFETFRTLP
jgi:hypothetical protein